MAKKGERSGNQKSHRGYIYIFKQRSCGKPQLNIDT